MRVRGLDPGPWSPQRLRKQLPPLVHSKPHLGGNPGEVEGQLNTWTHHQSPYELLESNVNSQRCTRSLLGWLQGKVGWMLLHVSTDLILGDRENTSFREKASSICRRLMAVQEHKTTGRSEIKTLLTNWRPGPKERRAKLSRDKRESCSSAGTSSCTNTAGRAGAAEKVTWIIRQTSCRHNSKHAACKAHEGTPPPSAPAAPLLDGACGFCTKKACYRD